MTNNHMQCSQEFTQSSRSEGEECHRNWQAQPSMREILMIVAWSSILFVATIATFRNYSDAVSNFGDSRAYTSIASAIASWNFEHLQIKQFWGYPYAIAVLSLTSRISTQNSLLLVSVISSLASVLLVYKLWNGWVAVLFAVLSFDWLQRTFLGGSEPLAVLLIFGRS